MIEASKITIMVIFEKENSADRSKHRNKKRRKKCYDLIKMRPIKGEIY